MKNKTHQKLGQIIHPSNHSIKRFQERIVPFLPTSLFKSSNQVKQIKKLLYNLLQKMYIIDCVGNIKIPTFYVSKECPPIPITLVVNTKGRVLITLYISPNWEFVKNVWRAI